MFIGVPLEQYPRETRVSLIPESIKKLLVKGPWKFQVQEKAGAVAGYPDGAYREAGARLVPSYEEILKTSDLILMVNRPSQEDAARMKKGALLICQLDPFHHKDLLDTLAARHILAVSLEMIPRSTIAQKMDILSSQASLAGYMAVIRGASELGKVFPMMMTPAGTISPSRVFVIGAGVAGLQAIATARRLGANVSAFDTRPVVEEQVQSLGARFIKLDLGETEQTQDGYARDLTEEQLRKQRELMTKVCSQSDLVITTARVFGSQSPLIITSDMIRQMKPGSLIVDMAVDSGGNVEGVLPDETLEIHGVRILGYSRPERDAAYHASQMFSGNVTAFLETFSGPEGLELNLRQDHEILNGCVITRDGEIVHPLFSREE